MRRRLALIALLPLSGQTARAQISTELKPETLKAFQQYVAKVESGLDQRDEGVKPFLWLDENPKQREKTRQGEIVVHQFGDTIIEVENGLIHHWLGALFLPGVNLDEVSSFLHDFSRHVDYYPEVVLAELISKDGDVYRHRMRTQVKKVLTVVLDMKLEAHHKVIGDKRYAVRSYTDEVSEVKHSGTPKEIMLPDGEGTGFMWRLNSYWRLEETDGGVLTELETVSLSRAIPFGLGMVIRPFVQDVPKESLVSTLSSTRNALAK